MLLLLLMLLLPLLLHQGLRAEQILIMVHPVAAQPPPGCACTALSIPRLTGRVPGRWVGGWVGAAGVVRAVRDSPDIQEAS